MHTRLTRFIDFPAAFRWVLCLAVTLLAVPSLIAQEDEEAERVHDYLELQHNLTPDLPTPHTAWAKPYAGGTLRAVYIVTWFEGSTDAREIIELSQRLDLDARPVYVMNGDHLVGNGRPDWYGGDPLAGTKRVLRLLAETNDLIIINQVSLSVLPAEVREEIRQKAAAGAGLVIIGNLENSPYPEATPAAPSSPLIAAGKYLSLGRGRLALLPRREKLEYRLGWETQYDYQMEQQIRVMLWAAGREPKAKMDIQMPSVAQRESSSFSSTIIWSNLPSRAKFQAVLRRSDGYAQDLAVQKTRGRPSATVSLPRLREGEYHLDVFARRDGKILAWATEFLRVQSDRHLAAVELDQGWAEPGTRVQGRIRCTGNRHPNERLLLCLVDKHGRRLAEQVIAETDGASAFSFTAEPWMPALLRVEAVIQDGQDEVSAGYTYLRLTRRNADQFNFVVWNTPSGDLAPYGIRSLAHYGATAILQGGAPPLAFAENELAFVPYAASFRASSHTLTAMLDPTNGVLKSGCVFDTGRMETTVRQAVTNCTKAREHGVLVYSLGDENAVRASCLSPQCLAAYRRYLQAEYSSIDALNREWNTAYAAFDEITLLDQGELPAPDAPRWFKQYLAQERELHRTDSEGAKAPDREKQIALGEVNDELRALQAGNFARWYDRQAFQCYTYLQWCQQFRKAFRELDPEARTGFEGTDSFTRRRLTTRSRQGGDLDAFVRDLDYFGPYGGPANHVVRSLARPGFPMGNWTGYTPDGEVLLREYWSQITEDMNTIQWWRWDNLDGYHGYLMPSLAPFPATRALFNDTQIVRDGLGTLLMKSQRQDDGVAVLYSMPSTHIAFFDGNETYGDYKRDHEQWIHLIQSTGLQFRYVTDRTLRLGEFDTNHFKALVLPLAYALSPAEAEVIRRFVREGGTLIADLRPGLYDGHCKPLAQGQLDDVFGIQRGPKQDAIEIDRLNIDGEIQGTPIRMKWGNWHGHDIYPRMKIDPSVALTTGKSLGQAYQIHYWAGLNTPVGIVNHFGKGRAVLLNFSVFDAPVAPLLGQVLASAGVKPAIRVNTLAGAAPKDVVITRWRDGQIELFSLLGKYDGPVKVQLPAPSRIHDLKGRQSLGNSASFTTVLRPNRAAFFALLPEAAEFPELQVPESTSRGSVVPATIRVPHSSGLHAVRISATSPNGAAAEWLERVILVGAQPQPIPLPFALNDPAGTWQVQIQDLFGPALPAKTLQLH